MNLHRKYKNYRFKVSYCPGSANSADALSQGVEDPEEGLAEGQTPITFTNGNKEDRVANILQVFVNKTGDDKATDLDISLGREEEELGA